MSDMEAARLLDSAIATLERAIVPELARDESRIALDLVIRILGMLRARFSTQQEGAERLLAETLDLLAGIGAAPASASPDGAALSRLQRLDAELRQAEAALSQRIPALVADAGRQDAAARRTLQRIIDEQRRYLCRLDPDIAKGIAVVYRGGRIDREPQSAAPPHPINDASVGAYLRGKFPDRPGIAARDVKVVAGGFSKVTVLFTLEEAGRPPQELVMRRDLPKPFMNKSVLDEFALLRRLHPAGVRIAEPCWAESDASRFGGAFIVSRRVAGSSNVVDWSRHPGAAQQAAVEFAEVLAGIHGLDLGALGYDAALAGKSAGQALAEEIEWWARFYDECRTRAYPLIDIPLAWMRQNIPPRLFDMPARVVHGDVGFHNLMVEKGQVTALLDWEFAHFGDPGEDLAFARLFLEQIAGWDAFIARYRACGGIDYSEECGRFYKVWTSIRNTIGTIDAVARFHGTPIGEAEIKYAVAGVLGPYLQIDSSELVMRYMTE